MSAESTSHILQSLAVNVAITIAKGVAAVVTGSGALLAETIHTASDCANQLLLLVGVRQSKRAPDDSHPLGYGRTMYFWSFIVALLLFTGGGVFSIYEGIHKFREPEPVEHVWVGLGILLFSLALEGWATIGNLKEMKQRRGAKPLLRYLRETKDSDLVVVFGENSASVIGLGFAILALLASWQTNDGRYDALGSLLIGCVLVGVAIFLSVEVKSLLVGESADPEIAAAVEATAAETKEITRVYRIITVQQGPGEVLLACKIDCVATLTVAEVSKLINDFESRLRARRPEVRWIFVEPDLGESRVPKLATPSPSTTSSA
jgi:cation diffusion facilitator family transporter